MNILKYCGIWLMAMLAVTMMPVLILVGYSVSIEVEKMPD